MMISSLIFVSLAIASCSGLNLLQLAGTQPGLSQFIHYLNLSGLNSTLTAPGPFTVFAPNDAAFNNTFMPNETDDITEIIQAHIVHGNFSYTMLNGTLTSLNRVSLDVNTSTLSNETGLGRAPSKTINNATIVQPDLYADNGVIHTIDQVLNVETETEDEEEEPPTEPETSTEGSDESGQRPGQAPPEPEPSDQQSSDQAPETSPNPMESSSSTDSPAPIPSQQPPTPRPDPAGQTIAHY